MPRPGPLIVSGYLNKVLGLGQAANLTASGFEDAGFHCVRHDVGPMLSSEPPGPYDKVLFPSDPGGVWILHCNAPEAAAVLQKIPHRYWRDRYRIGIWAWELETLPHDWKKVAREFHEIWAPSHFVADAIRPHARLTKVMPHPMIKMEAAESDRARFGMPAEGMVFAAFADCLSVLARKNPLGAVTAFRRAFPQPSSSACLVIKLIHADEDALGVAELEAAAAGRPDICFFVEELDRAGIAAFLASIDAVISLHRSEGFGLVLAEALSLGKPVIATGWSGNLDFMTASLAEGLVRSRLVPTQDPTGRYGGARWADPDLDHAAELIRKLVDDPDFYRRLVQAAPAASQQLGEAWARDRLMEQPFVSFLS